MTKQPTQKQDIERIGERKKYRGIFKLFRTDNPFPYVKGKLSFDGMFKKGIIVPDVKLNCFGTYAGEGRFLIDNGDMFLE